MGALKYVGFGILTLIILQILFGWGTHARMNNFYNNECPATNDGFGVEPLFENDDYSIVCFYENDDDNDGVYLLHERNKAFLRGLVSPLNLLRGNTCASGYGDKAKTQILSGGDTSTSFCSVLPIWVSAS